MKEIKIDKITLNMGIGQTGDKLDRAVRLLERITSSKPVKTTTMERIPTWGLRPKLPIGCKVTLHGKKAEKMLPKLLTAVDNKLKPKSFDKEGNFAFGIPEYIDIQDVDYDVEVGIIGLEVAVTLKRPGYRIKLRKVQRKRIPFRHRITKEEAINYMKEKFNAEVVE